VLFVDCFSKYKPVANLVHTLDWRARNARRAAPADRDLLEEVLRRVVPLIGAAEMFSGD